MKITIVVEDGIINIQQHGQTNSVYQKAYKRKGFYKRVNWRPYIGIPVAEFIRDRLKLGQSSEQIFDELSQIKKNHKVRISDDCIRGSIKWTRWQLYKKEGKYDKVSKMRSRKQ